MEETFFQVLAKTDHEKRGRLYAIYFLENSLFPQDNEKELFEKWSEKEEWKSFEKICTALWNDIRYFPVPESPKHPQYQVSFVDSWMGERTYGGKRGHEGCDLMASKDIPGLYPVVSMTDGGSIGKRLAGKGRITGSGLPHRPVHISIMHIWTLMEVIRRGTR